MHKQNHNSWHEKIEKQQEKKEKRKKKKMKISGGSVKELQKIIQEKI